MRTYSLIATAAAFAALAATMTGCSGTASTSTIGDLPADSSITSVEFTQNIINGKRYYVAEDPDLGQYSVTLSAQIDWPATLGAYDLKPLQDSLLKFITPQATTTVADAIDRFLNDTSEWGDSITRVDSLPAFTGEDDYIPRDYYLSIEASVAELSTDYITMELGAESYGGGAHPMYGSNDITYLLKEGRIVTYEWLFKPGTEKILMPALTGAVCMAANMASEQELKQNMLVDTLPVSHSVSIESGMIVFHYGLYDILPYASGMTDAQVSPEEVREALTPQALELFGIDQ